jgi:hypothetical protein
MKPGDLIEWVYRCDGDLAETCDEIYSTLEYEWVPIGSGLTHLCVSCDDTTYAWLNEKGLFRARRKDGTGLPDDHEGVLPRVREPL